MNRDQDFIFILNKCKDGNRRYQERIYSNYYSLIFKTCLRYTSDNNTSLDYTQDIFIRIFNKLNEFRGESYKSFGAWIKLIAITYCIDQYRKSKAAKTIKICNNYDNINQIADDQSELEFEEPDVIKAIRTLTPQYRNVLNMYIIEDMSHEDIANKLGISVGTSKSNLHRARKNLKIQLDKIQ